MSAFSKAIVTGTLLQVAMVVTGHSAPALQAIGLFPIAGTIIGAVTGWLAGAPARGAVAGGAAGALGSLVSTMLGDVPLANIGIAGGSTLVMGAMGGAVRRWRARRARP